MRPPRYYHNILHSIESDDMDTTIDSTVRRPSISHDESLIEAAIAMQSQTFEENRAQCMDYLRLWGRLRPNFHSWESVVILLDQMAFDFNRYKYMIGDHRGRCFQYKCDGIIHALEQIASEIREDKKIRHRTEWKMDMLYRCIGRLTMRGYDHSDDSATQRSIRNCAAVQRTLQSQTEMVDWRTKDEMDTRLRFWNQVYFDVPHCSCLQCSQVRHEFR